MKRLHVNLQVHDIEASTAFYNALFGATPTVSKVDYSKWLLEEPRVNFSISLGGDQPGIRHLGIEAETTTELEEIYANVKRTNQFIRAEGHTTCCYAKSEKSWVKDPQGVEWEAFQTYAESEVNRIVEPTTSDGCCIS